MKTHKSKAPRPQVIDKLSTEFRVHTFAKQKEAHGEKYYDCAAVIPSRSYKDTDEIWDKGEGIKRVLSKIGVFNVDMKMVCNHYTFTWVMGTKAARQRV